jgi:hypothetical protein
MEISNQPLRFFGSPVRDGGPDFAWHSVDDLRHCLGVPPKKRGRLIREHRASGIPISMIATSDGPILVAPHCAALALIEAYASVIRGRRATSCLDRPSGSTGGLRRSAAGLD